MKKTDYKEYDDIQRLSYHSKRLSDLKKISKNRIGLSESDRKKHDKSRAFLDANRYINGVNDYRIAYDKAKTTLNYYKGKKGNKNKNNYEKTI